MTARKRLSPLSPTEALERQWIRGRGFTLTRCLWSIVGDLATYPGGLDGEAREELRAIAKRLVELAKA